MQQQRDDALDALADRTLSARLRAAYADRGEAAVEEYETRLQQQRTLRAGVAALDERMRVLKATLESRLIDAARWQEMAAQQAFRRALHLLVHKAALVEVERGTYRVDLEIYTVDDLVRETVNSERAWESNPPAKFVTPPSRFEDGGQHRPTPTLTGHATGGSTERQADT